MDTLSLVIFILAFGGMVIIHEFGRFIVARWSKIEVEEFGIGLPTPGALTLWSGKGYLLLKSGKRIEIPFNFKFPLNWTSVVGEEAKIQVDQANDQLVLRSIEVVKIEERRRSADLSAGLDHIYVDSNGAVVPSPEDSNQNISRRIVQAGKPGG